MFSSIGLDLYYNNLQALKGVALSSPSMRHGGLWAMWAWLVVTGLLVICCGLTTLLRKKHQKGRSGIKGMWLTEQTGNQGRMNNRQTHLHYEQEWGWTHTWQHRANRRTGRAEVANWPYFWLIRKDSLGKVEFQIAEHVYPLCNVIKIGLEICAIFQVSAVLKM